MRGVFSTNGWADLDNHFTHRLNKSQIYIIVGVENMMYSSFVLHRIVITPGLSIMFFIASRLKKLLSWHFMILCCFFSEWHFNSWNFWHNKVMNFFKVIRKSEGCFHIQIRLKSSRACILWLWYLYNDWQVER